MKAEVLKKLSEAVKRYRYMLLVIAAGLLLLLLPTGKKTETEPAAAPDYEAFELAEFESRIESALEKIDGVGKTEVVLTLGSTMETVYQSDLTSDERDGSASRRSDTVLENSGSGTQSAVVRERIYPKFRGALVVCEGASSASVRLEVTRAVETLTGLSGDSITVLRRGAD